jgi:SAM-dependent methyltransferase
MRLSRRPLVDLSGPDDPRIAAAAERSPLVSRLELSQHADADELRFREHIEPYEGIEAALGFLRRKRVLDYLDHVLRRTEIAPSGVVVELGAGSCWLSSALACFPDVTRVAAVEFSQRRLTSIAPPMMALLDAPAEKIERRVADFYAHGLEPASADLVVVDASFHHASDPALFARVAFDLTRPGGTLLLLREPTLALLRRSRDHGIEGEHGDFEHEYWRREYLGFLQRAGFEARSVRVRWFPSSGWRKLLYRPPLTLVTGPLRGNYAYVGRRLAGA